jgi:hypothetical protein
MANDSTRQHLLGTWKLITAVREEISSGTKTEFLGPNPVGYINYGADGRMLVLTVASGRHKPAGPKATSAEVEALFRSMSQLWRDLQHRRQRDHPSCRCFLEPELDRDRSEARRPFRGQSRLPLDGAFARSDHRHDERAHHDLGEAGLSASCGGRLV